MATIDFARVQTHLGEFGTFQAIVFGIGCLSQLFVGIHMLANAFLLGIPDHRCLVPNCDTNTTGYVEDFVAFTIPNDTDSSCRRYAFRPHENHCSERSMNYNRTLSCRNYIWDNTVFENTVVSEFNLVCNNQRGQVASSSIFMAGVLIGAAIFGMIADKFGRKTVMIIASFVQVVSAVALAFMPNIELFTFIHFITASATVGLAQISFLIAIEFIGTSKRVLYANLLMLTFTVGELCLGLAAYYFRQWRHLLLVVSVPGIVLFALCWILPESVMWMISEGRLQEAKKTILRAAKFNKVAIPEDLLNVHETKSDFYDEKQSRLYGPMDLIKTPRLRKWSLNIFYAWIVNAMVFYGLSLSAGHLSGNIYTNFALLAIAEIPSSVLVTWALHYCGRRVVLCFVMVFGGIACGTTAFIPASLSWMTTILAILGKSAISASFGIIYIYTCEIYPTAIRSTGLGFSSMFARFGGIFAPIVSNLNTVFSSLPMIIFSAASISSGLLVLALPETFNRQLPETIEEAEGFGLPSKPYEVSIAKLLRATKEEETLLLSSEE